MRGSSKSLGKFILRVPQALHRRLKSRSAELGLSLNEYCSQVLDGGSSGARTDDAFARALASRAHEVCGESLLGVILYGSWVRGEANDLSDIDVMLVVDEQVEVTRSLIGKWDEQPLSHGGREVEAHFVRIPAQKATLSGLWAELAIDGIVVFERGFKVSGVLSRVRGEIAAGRLQRRRSHGQHYWVHENDGVA